MQLRNLSMSFGNQELFNDVTLDISDNEKVGVVGVNGAGKSTFFKLILGILSPDKGKIIINQNYHIAYLPQIISDDILDSNETVMDYLLNGRPIEKLTKELENLYYKVSLVIDENEINTIYKKIDKIEQKLNYYEYTSCESILLKIIDGMNIEADLLNKKVTELSGGQKSKVAFARLLYSKPEIILLDEPTNHLDQVTKDFVINYIKNYKGSVYIISHDVEFLNQIATKILFLDKRTKNFTLFDGNYDKFIKVSKEREKAIIDQANIQQQEIDNLRSIVLKYSNSSGKRKRMAQDREKKLNKLLENKIEIPAENKQAYVDIKMNRSGSNIPLRVENLCFKYDKESENNIINNLTFDLSKGEKFLIVGENGIGKSTLLKLIIGQLKPDSGNITLGNQTDFGYYAQEHELLDMDKTILENFQNLDVSTRNLRAALGRFLFFNDDIYKKIKVLSPGERARVALCKLSLSGANFLVLDEPTNHLDPETQKIIAQTFKDFKGTMLVVSHNLEFVDNLNIERTLVLPSGRISYYDKELVIHYGKINTEK